MSRVNILQIVSFFIYLFYQVLILKNIVLFHTAFCFLYVAYLLVLPVESNQITLMLIGFVLGFSVDVFYDSLGLHALACVLIMYARNSWLNVLTPQGGYDSNSIPSMSMNGIQWFVVYAIPMVFLHHAILFFTEAGGFDMFWFTMLKIMNSTLFTMLAIVIAQFLFPYRKRL